MGNELHRAPIMNGMIKAEDLGRVNRAIDSATLFIDAQVRRLWPNLNLGDAASVIVVSAPPTRPAVERVLSATPGESEIVTIGGGSTHDFGKLFAFGSAQDGSLPATFEWNDSLELATLTAVPTTFGTGAEYSPVAVLHGSGPGSAVGANGLRPKTVISFPGFLRTLPPAAAACCFLDGISHCTESILSSPSNAVVVETATEALTAFLSLRGAGSVVNSSELVRAATVRSAKALSLSKRNTPHLLAAALSDSMEIPHGLAAGICLSAYLDRGLPRSFPVDDKTLTRSVDHWLSIAWDNEAALPSYERLSVAIQEEAKITGPAMTVNDAQWWSKAILRTALALGGTDG